MIFWRPNHLKSAMRALQIDDRPLRDAYARRAHTTIAMMRDRLAEDVDHLTLVWPDFDSYREFVFSNARHSRRRDERKLWEERGSGTRRAFQFSAISDFTVVTEEVRGRVQSVEFWPDNPPGVPSREGPPWIVKLP